MKVKNEIIEWLYNEEKIDVLNSFMFLIWVIFAFFIGFLIDFSKIISPELGAKIIFITGLLYFFLFELYMLQIIFSFIFFLVEVVRNEN